MSATVSSRLLAGSRSESKRKLRLPSSPRISGSIHNNEEKRRGRMTCRRSPRPGSGPRPSPPAVKSVSPMPAVLLATRSTPVRPSMAVSKVALPTSMRTAVMPVSPLELACREHRARDTRLSVRGKPRSTVRAQGARSGVRPLLSYGAATPRRCRACTPGSRPLQ